MQYLWASVKLPTRTKVVQPLMLSPPLASRTSINLHVFIYLCKISSMWVITLPLQKNSQGYQLSLWLKLMILFLGWFFIPSPMSQVNGGFISFHEKSILVFTVSESWEYGPYDQKMSIWSSFFKAHFLLPCGICNAWDRQ